jgi:hypothetical protein
MLAAVLAAVRIRPLAATRKTRISPNICHQPQNGAPPR